VRSLAVALLIANLALLAWGWLRENTPGADDALVHQQVNPERLRILGDEPEAAAPVPEACLEWAPFAAEEVERARAALEGLALGPRLQAAPVPVPAGWWVYIPPQKSRELAERKVAELTKLGVGETYLVQERGEWENAVSLGIFRSEDGAQRFLEALKARGVRSAVVGARQQQVRLTALYIRNPLEAETQRMLELRPSFAGTSVRGGRCP
jgi:hypothetical protein